MALILALALLFAGCMPNKAVSREPAGFLTGIWQGWVAPFSLIWSFSNPNIRIYEPNNTGWAYDLGYYMAIIGGIGGLALFRKRRH